MGIAVRFSTVIWVEAMVGLSFLGPRKIDPPYSRRHNRPVVSEKSCRSPRTTRTHVDTDDDTAPIAATKSCRCPRIPFTCLKIKSLLHGHLCPSVPE